MSKPVKIVCRTSTCPCCEGRDPWHKRSYNCAVSNIEQVSIERTRFDKRAGYLVRSVVTQRGLAQMPWGEMGVVFVCKSSADGLSKGEWQLAY